MIKDTDKKLYGVPIKVDDVVGLYFRCVDDGSVPQLKRDDIILGKPIKMIQEQLDTLKESIK